MLDEPNVYVAGDLAAFEQDGAYLPMVAQVAMQQGETAANNIMRQIAGKPLQRFVYKDKGSMAVIGRNAAVANIAGRAITGFAAWLIWLLVHIAQLIGYRNRLLVLVNWAWSYFAFERLVRLILPNRLIEEEKQGVVADPDKPVEPEFVNE
jgi:NADH dehydrogenase